MSTKRKDYFIGGRVKKEMNIPHIIRLGISRALNTINEDYRKIIKDKGFLTRDARKVERKKPGQPGARKNFQFSKR